MARWILVPIGGSSRSHEAFEYAAREHLDATFVALTVSNPTEMSVGGTEARLASYADEWMEIEERRTEERFERTREIAEERGVSLETESILGRPARVIVEFAEEHDVDAIVMGSHGRDGVSRLLLGSVRGSVRILGPIGTLRVLMTSPRPSSGARPVRSPWSADGSHGSRLARRPVRHVAFALRAPLPNVQVRIHATTTGAGLVLLGLTHLLVPGPLLAAARVGYDRLLNVEFAPDAAAVRRVRFIGLVMLAVGTVVGAVDETLSVGVERT